MHCNLQTPENPPPSSSEDQTHLATIPPNTPATASLSLSLLHFNKNLVFNAKIASFLQPNPINVKIPSHVSTLSYLRISSSIPLPLKPSFKSKISAAAVHFPQTLNPRRPSDPQNASGVRRTSIVWFRNDLRVHDNESLNSANDDSASLLPVYCFDDPKDGKTSSFGVDKASFLIQSVLSLRENLRSRGSDLVIRIGKVENVLVELAKEVGADAVYAHNDVSREDIELEEKVEAALKDEGVEVRYFWGSTLYHVDDLPFQMEETPSKFGRFREKVGGLEIRKSLDALDQLKGKPSRGNVEFGDVPSLMDLGLKPNASMAQDEKSATCSTIAGGETEALKRLQKLATEFQTQPAQGTKDSIFGANFSCKISQWLATGCISPRSVFDEMKKAVARTILPAASSKINSDTSMSWLLNELMWRDFFRFVTKNYSSATKHNAAPAHAFTGALA